MDLSKRESQIKQKYGHRIKQDSTIDSFMRWTNDHDINEVGLAAVWNRNAELNMQLMKQPEWKKKYVGSIYQLLPHKEKAAIYVGRGPSILKAEKMLQKVDRNLFVIISTNSSVRWLLERDIVPDYMICIDGRNNASYWTFKDLPEKADQVEAWLSISACPHAYKYWPGMIRIIPMGGSADPAIRTKIVNRYGKLLPGGGNAFNEAIFIAMSLTSLRMHLLVGNNLSFETQHYADSKSIRDETPHFSTKNIYGEEVGTEIPFWIYKTWLESLIFQAYPEHMVINCSEGILGVDPRGNLYPHIDHMPLDMAMDRVKKAIEMESLPYFEKAKMVYTTLINNGSYNPKEIRYLKDKYYKTDKNPFKKGLDVGCSTGTGVKHARDRGYNMYGCDIADAKERWKEKGIEKYCTTCPAHKMPYKNNEFDHIVCTEVLEHIPEQYIDDTLKEIKRVGSNRFSFTIHLSLESKPAFKGMYLHFLVKPSAWWLRKFKEHGFKILGWDECKEVNDMVIEAAKGVNS